MIRIKINNDFSKIDSFDKEIAIQNSIMYKGELQVFFAFSFKDIEFADWLAKMLQERGIRTWLATQEIKPRDDWQSKVKKSLKKSGYFLAIISNSSVKSYWTQWEFQMAIEREKKYKSPHVIPILIEDAKIPLYFDDRQYVDFRNCHNKGIEKIVAIIETKLEYKSESIRLKEQD